MCLLCDTVYRISRSRLESRTSQSRQSAGCAAVDHLAKMSASPPPFVEPYPGFSNENKGPLIVVVTSTLTALALLFVIARVYSRLLSVGNLAVDDYIVMLSIVC